MRTDRYVRLLRASYNEGLTTMTALKRLRLTLENHKSDLLLVGDRFEEGGAYVAQEVPMAVSATWSWLDWDDYYDTLAAGWHQRFGTQSAEAPAAEPLNRDPNPSDIPRSSSVISS